MSSEEIKYGCTDIIIEELKSAGYTAFLDDSGDNDPVLRISWKE